ncbi:MAG: caspase family protein [Pseudomonadaceae bacterium]|nr:caspase family protein [Pseudomonadaceae bacterium]
MAETTQNRNATRAELQIVDCLLPGQVRRLGNRTYLTARRPLRTTAGDCALRGGEYTAFDRADYRTALTVWMAAAEAGDPEAQTNVGEIFEKGLGGEANPQAALIWYQRAADQGYSRAQFNLGTLFELGKGVDKDPIVALNWYRRAWGLAQDSLLFTSAARAQQQKMADELNRQLSEKTAQIEALEAQLRTLRSSLNASSAQAEASLKTLEGLVANLRSERAAQDSELARIQQTLAVATPAPIDSEQISALRQPADSASEQISALIDTTNSNDNDGLGKYYALLIGNAEYDRMEDLQTPHNDIQRAKDILEQRYGFTVFTLTDASDVAIMQAINDLSSSLTETDNLLIFYAGHGSRLNAGENQTGYWLPRNAERPPRNTYWVANEFVTGHLSRLKARRVLVVADSCYAGLLSNEPSLLLLGDDMPQYSDPEFLRFKLNKRARLLLTSGGDAPVLDSAGDGHSVFASAFLDALEANNGLLAAPELFLRIRNAVTETAAQQGFEQKPELKTIRAAGHDVGDFFFYPISNHEQSTQDESGATG